MLDRTHAVRVCPAPPCLAFVGAPPPDSMAVTLTPSPLPLAARRGVRDKHGPLLKHLQIQDALQAS